jgi:CDP-4-dehydro-6-deoxyglucose reductase
MGFVLMTIFIHYNDMNLEWLQGIVTDRIDEAYNTKRIFIEVQGIEQFDFKPGQFVTLDLPIHEKKNKRWRSYSIASAPNGGNTFELIIVLLEGGLGSNFLCNEIKIGDTITFRGPTGVFVLPETMDQNYYMICTGTGIAPFRSMIHHIQQQQIPTKNIYLIFGSRTQHDLLYFDELNALQNQMPQFHFIPTLSREEWTGEHGYVHAIYQRLCKEDPDAQFLLCGWKKMIDEARNNLLTMGYDKKQIQFELYG